MNLKQIVKRILCPISCLRHGIKNHDGFLYVGIRSKIVNGSNIIFGNNVSIMPDNMIVCHGDTSRLILGEGFELGMYSRIGCLNYISIGKNVLTGPHVFIADYNHEYIDPNTAIKLQGNSVKWDQEFSGGGISIGDDTWIGTNVVIAGTIKIGKHCVIGANSVVTKDIPDYTVAVGIPCKPIKRYNFENEKWEPIIPE